jgi:hypothetical protein
VTPNQPQRLGALSEPLTGDLSASAAAQPVAHPVAHPAAAIASAFAALDVALDALQGRLEPLLTTLRDRPDADAEAMAALGPLLAERQRLLAQQATLWRRWRAQGGQLLWTLGVSREGEGVQAAKPSQPAQPAKAAQPEVSTGPAEAGQPQRVAVRVLQKPAPAADEPPPRFAVTDDVRATIQSALAGALDTRPPEGAVETPQLDILQALLRLVGPPVFLAPEGGEDALARALDELEALRRVVEPHVLASLQRLPRGVQAHFLGMVIARLRGLQELPGGHVAAAGALFPHLESFSRLHQPGPINGFSRKHGPLRGAWLKDARAHHQRLTDLLQPPSDLPDNPEHLLARITARLDALRDAPPNATSAPAPEVSGAGAGDPTPEADPSGHADADLTALCKRFIHVASDNDPRLLRLMGGHLDRLSGKVRKRVKKALDRAARHLRPTPPDLASAPTPDTSTGAVTEAASDAATDAAPDAASAGSLAEADLAATPSEELGEPDFLARWAWRVHTEGKRAVVVGGEDQREDIRARAAVAFGFAALEWHPANQPKRLEVLARRAQQGSFDLVILLKRFISHRVEDILVKRCKKYGVRYLYLEQGYAPESLRRAIERYLPPA